ncbi:ABC transporter substrate-binding protein [Dictyobacter kobayashii]|uniref:Sugar ABC transporter substrate-binding protein n=1 Tax=Dictyobacter kobayashii TaxID=2014872 RepID=A0A402AWE4_9CHLR|nr:sugar ABC transporter substrate-binding protein [Dictyobacter kobayashii]GCE23452.1 hypothetical protein KDK_72520 [Dictyobacter kobayashii]
MLKRLSRTLILGAFLCLIILVNTGCSVLGINAKTFSGQTTVTWLVRTDPNINPWEYKVVDEFEASHPTIHIKMVLVPSGANFDQKLVTMQVGWEPADIFSIWGNNSWADEVYRGFAADLTPYIKASNFSFDGMDQKLLDQYSVNGHVYAIPFSTGGSYVFYNVDMFKQAHLPMPPTSWDDPGWTWDAMLKDAQAMTVHSSSLNNRRYGMSDDLWPEDANPMLFGGDYFQQSTYQNGVVAATNATSPAVVQSVQWKRDLMYKYQVAPLPADASLLNGFLSGKVGMSMTGVWGLWANKPATFHWAIAPLPHFSSNTKDVLFTDPWMLAKDSKHPKEAWTFLQWLSDPAHGAKSYMEVSGAMSPWSQLLPEWAANTHKIMPSLSTDQLMQLGQGSLNHGQESINHLAISYNQFDSVISNVLSPVYNTGKVDPTSALNDVQKQLQETIHQVVL